MKKAMVRKQVKRAAAVTLSAVMAATMAGCTGSQQTASTAAPSESEAPAGTEAPKAEAAPVELKVLGFKTGSEEGAIPELIKQFNEANPDIVVTYEGISNAGGYQDVLTSRLASGQGDDVFFANPNYLAQLQEAGYTEDLTAMPVVSEYSGLVKDLLTVNGEIPGLAMEVAVFGMFSNMDLLKEVGIDKAPENYEEFLADCQILQDAGKTPMVAGAKDGTGLAVLTLAKGLDPVYTASDKMSQIDQINKGELKYGDVLKPGFELIEDLIQKKYVDGSKALVYAAGQDDIAEFAKGETGFMPGGNWFISGIQAAAPDMNLSLGGIPVEDKDSLILINAGTRVCINSASKNKDAAKKFVEFFTSQDSINAYVESQSSFNPCSGGAATESTVVSAAAERLAAARMVPWVDSAFKNTVVDPWGDARKYSSNIAGGESVDDCVKDLNTQIENNIKLN